MDPFACGIILIKNGKVLLIKRATAPFKGEWALPGGHIVKGETKEQCAQREIKEETGLDVELMVVIGSYFEPGWDPPGKTSVIFLAKEIGGELKAGGDAKEAAWFHLDSVPQLCANHNEILANAVRQSINSKKEEPTLIFYDTNGKIITAADQELIFFVENPSIKKSYPNLFVLLKRLIQNRAPRQFLLFLKRVITGRWHGFYERLFVRKGVYPGMRTDRAEFTTPDVKMTISCSGENVPADIDILTQVLLHNQYNISNKNMEGKIVIDAGANIGTFSIYAGKLGAKRVYAFEPVTETFEILRKNIAANGLEKIVVPVNMVLGEAVGRKAISYGFAGDAGASTKIIAPIIQTQNADMITIDKFMKGKGPVDFIKMDVEGYEAEVFQGARSTIEKFKPVLSFAVYHHPDDKKKLTEIVKRIRSDYKCRLIKRGEEDLYCE